MVKFTCDWLNRTQNINSKDLKSAFLRWAKQYSKTIDEKGYAIRVDLWISRKENT